MQEKNWIIAEYMGYTKHFHGSYYTAEKDGKHIFENVLQYNTSWEWIMPVIEKIADTKRHSMSYTLELVAGNNWDGIQELFEATAYYIKNLKSTQ